MIRLASSTTLFLLLLSIAALAEPQQAVDPATLPARDAHQGLLVAADPYTDEARSKETFGKKHPQEAGVLALMVYFRNDTDKPISVNLERMRLLLSVPGAEHQRLEPLVLEGVLDRLMGKGGPNPTVSRVPIPGRGAGGKSKDREKLKESIKPKMLASDILPPHATTKGFLFFDLNHRFEWVAHATFYVPELHFIPSNESLLYFEVDLAPAVRH